MKRVSAAQRRAEALAAYDAAFADPNTDWRRVADLLRHAMPTTRATVAAPADDWGDYPLPQKYRSDRHPPAIAVHFADGELVRCPAPSLPDKPVNIGRALRVAIAFYRSRSRPQIRNAFFDYDRRIPVPEIRVVRAIDDARTWDADRANRETADERTGDPDTVAARIDELGRDWLVHQDEQQAIGLVPAYEGPRCVILPPVAA